MANVTISNLPPANSAANLDVFAIVAGGVTSKITVGDLVTNVIQPNINPANFTGNIGSFTGTTLANNIAATVTFRGNALFANLVPVQIGQHANGDPIFPDLGSPSNPWNVIYATRSLSVGGPTGVSISNESGTASFTDPAGTPSGIAAAGISGDGITANSITVTGLTNGNTATYSGPVSVNANVSANYFIGNGAFLTGIAAGYSNADVANYLPTYTGNLVALTGNVTTTANVQAAYLIGNGSQLTGLAAGYSNANVFSYLGSNSDVVITTTGNITGGNLTAISASGTANSVIRTTGQAVEIQSNLYVNTAPSANSVIRTTGQAVVVESNLVATGNVAGNYFIGNGSQLTGLAAGYSNANVFDYLGSNSNVVITTTGNVTSGNLTAISTSGTANAVVRTLGAAIEIQSNLYVNTAPSANAVIRTLGTAVVVESNLVANGANVTATYFIGNGAFLTGIAAGYSNADVANYLASNITSNIATQANISGDYVLGNGAFLTGIATGTNYSNANVFDYLGSNSNVVITTTGNITGGNLTAISASGTANSVIRTLGVAVEIQSNLYVNTAPSANSVIRTTGQAVVVESNLVATGNVTGTYILGNGAFLSGIATGTDYSNANVLSYLEVFPGNIIPNANATYSLGNSTNQWSNLWVSNTTIYLGGVPLAVTTGNILTVNGQPVLSSGSNTTIISSGNIEGGNIITENAIYISNSAINVQPGNILTVNNQAVLVDGGNTDITVSGSFTTTAGVTAANLRTDNLLYANGNPWAFPAGYSNAEVANYLPTYAGNLSPGNLTVANDAVITGNLRVLGNTTFIDANTLVIGDLDIVVANNAATASDANGAGILVGSTGQYASLIWRYGGNLWDFSGNVAADYLFGDAIEATSNLRVTGIGNITSLEAGNVKTDSLLYANGNPWSFGSTYGNADVANYLPTYTGNLVSLTGNITTTANISGDYFLGNIRFANGGYGNADVFAYLGSGSNVSLITTGRANVANLAISDGGIGNAVITTAGTAVEIQSNLWVRGITQMITPNTFANLPSATGNAGARAFVTDSNLVANGNFGNVVAGGGANFAPVYSDGTDWRIG